MTHVNTTKTTVPYVRTKDGITLVVNGKPFHVAKDETHYPDILAALKDGAPGDKLVDIIEANVRAVQAATQITAAIRIDNGVVFYNGQPLHNSMTERMVDMLNEGFDLKPMALFLENLMQNPSYVAVSELYGFLEKGKMPITPDGHFMAYKAVRGDFKDIHSGTFDNSIGAICEMPRNQVDDNRERTCSAGLHFCSWDYLPHFAHANGHVMLVKINPKDVVSIPADYNDTKGRCARYEVVGEYEGYYTEQTPYFTTMVYDPSGNGNGGRAFGDEEENYTVVGYCDSHDVGIREAGEELDTEEDLSDAKHSAVDYSDDYAVVTVEDKHGRIVFRLNGRG